MNKTGFTLSEVLITLIIIGVIAVITIPAMLQNIQEAHFKAAWKETYSILSQATKRMTLDNGGTLKGVFTSFEDMLDEYSNYMISSKICKNDTSCWHGANTWHWLNNNPVNWGANNALQLNNGVNVEFSYSGDSDCNNNSWSSNIFVCGWGFADVNGHKGPNVVGRDIFAFWITSNSLLPQGIIGDGNDDSCNVLDTGEGCAAIYLKQ